METKEDPPSFRVFDATDDNGSASLDFSDDDESDIEQEKVRDAKFEFSDSYKIMRLIKLLLFVQVLGILTDNPSIKISVLFSIISRGLLFYSIRFYSRPFIDLIYLVQYFFASLIALVPAAPSSDNIEITRRHLLANVTQMPEEEVPFFINVLDPESWHAVKIFSHYFLGTFICVC